MSFDSSKYRYDIPADLVAQEPALPRDASRLFVYDTKTDKITFDSFSNIGTYLPRKSLLALNNTKVIPARVELIKQTGGKVVLLFLANEYGGGASIEAISDRKLAIGQELSFSSGQKMRVVGQRENIFVLEFLFDPNFLPSLLFTYGTTPIPPYIDSFAGSEKDLRARYQTVFAENPASVAAPTASLHFTQELLHRLEEEGIHREYVTLHVGMGTFAPVRPEQTAVGKLHEEFFEITPSAARTLVKHKEEGKPIVAVGTTVVRTLESAADRILGGNAAAGKTDIFIYPPFEFKIVDALVTNFHVPESSLMALVDAFLLHKKAEHSILDLYNIAIAERFRFFSFGDAMLIV